MSRTSATGGHHNQFWLEDEGDDRRIYLGGPGTVWEGPTSRYI